MIPIVYHVLSANVVAYHKMDFHDAQSVLSSICERQPTCKGTSDHRLARLNDGVDVGLVADTR